MWYDRGHENAHLHSTPNRERTEKAQGGAAFFRCLCLASLPDCAGICPWGTSSSDRPSTATTPKSLATRATCPLTSPFATPCTCSFLIIFITRVALYCSPRCPIREKAHPWFRQPFDEPMVLLDQVTPVFDLPQFHVCRQDSGGFDLGNRFRIGGVLIHSDDARSRSAGMRGSWHGWLARLLLAHTDVRNPGSERFDEKILAASASRVGLKKHSIGFPWESTARERETQTFLILMEVSSTLQESFQAFR
jgi:hypothetical protein